MLARPALVRFGAALQHVATSLLHLPGDADQGPATPPAVSEAAKLAAIPDARRGRARFVRAAATVPSDHGAQWRVEVDFGFAVRASGGVPVWPAKLWRNGDALPPRHPFDSAGYWIGTPLRGSLGAASARTRLVETGHLLDVLIALTRAVHEAALLDDLLRAARRRQVRAAVAAQLPPDVARRFLEPVVVRAWAPTDAEVARATREAQAKVDRERREAHCRSLDITQVVVPDYVRTRVDLTGVVGHALHDAKKGEMVSVALDRGSSWRPPITPEMVRDALRLADEGSMGKLAELTELCRIDAKPAPRPIGGGHFSIGLREEPGFDVGPPPSPAEALAGYAGRSPGEPLPGGVRGIRYEATPALRSPEPAPFSFAGIAFGDGASWTPEPGGNEVVVELDRDSPSAHHLVARLPEGVVGTLRIPGREPVTARALRWRTFTDQTGRLRLSVRFVTESSR
jgi:head-tail adaptor